MLEWWVVLVYLENSVWIAECTTSQVRLEIDIWEEKREVKIEFYKWEIVDKRVIAFRTEKTL